MTSWTAEFTWPNSPAKARERISQWTGDLEPTSVEFRTGDDATTVVLTVEADTLLEAHNLVRQFVDEFLGPETALDHLVATDAL